MEAAVGSEASGLKALPLDRISASHSALLMIQAHSRFPMFANGYVSV